MSLTPTTIKHGRVCLQSLNCHDIYSRKRLRSRKCRVKNHRNKKRQFKTLCAEILENRFMFSNTTNYLKLEGINSHSSRQLKY